VEKLASGEQFLWLSRLGGQVLSDLFAFFGVADQLQEVDS
jgi:hypothetical protein